MIMIKGKLFLPWKVCPVYLFLIMEKPFKLRPKVVDRVSLWMTLVTNKLFNTELAGWFIKKYHVFTKLFGMQRERFLQDFAQSHPSSASSKRIL